MGPPGTGWSPSTWASRPPPPATSPHGAARCAWYPPPRPPPRSSPKPRTGCSSATAPATRPRPRTRWTRCARCWTPGCPSSASAWAARSSPWPRGGSPPPATTTASPPRCRVTRTVPTTETFPRKRVTQLRQTFPRKRATAPHGPTYLRSHSSRSAPRTDRPWSVTSTSTTAWSKACAWSSARCSASSTTPRPLPARTMPPTTSTSSAPCSIAGPGGDADVPRRQDLKSVLVIGSGPIVIGQGCEFDYSGTQACRVLKQEGIRVSLVNSNPATIMTDPEFADATYVEPITTETLEKVIAIERPDAVLPTLGGQTALNAAVALHDSGTLKKYNVELIGADIDAIEACEDREKFKHIVIGLGAEVPRSVICHTITDCLRAVYGAPAASDAANAGS